MGATDFIKEYLPELAAGGFERCDGTVQFYSRVNALLRSDLIVLDFGAGRGLAHTDDPVVYRRQLAGIRGKVAEVIGADVDPIVKTNPGLDRAIIIDGHGGIPLPDASIDLIVSDFTFEHLPDPERSSAELDRVLKPGGWICARTPNRYGYIALGNRLTPDRLKDRTLRSAQTSRKEQDVFPAFYRLNTIGVLERMFPKSRFEHANYHWDAQPAYHFNRSWIFRMFATIQYLTPPPLRTVLMVFVRKRS